MVDNTPGQHLGSFMCGLQNEPWCKEQHENTLFPWRGMECREGSNGAA